MIDTTLYILIALFLTLLPPGEKSLALRFGAEGKAKAKLTLERTATGFEGKGQAEGEEAKKMAFVRKGTSFEVKVEGEDAFTIDVAPLLKQLKPWKEGEAQNVTVNEAKIALTPKGKSLLITADGATIEGPLGPVPALAAAQKGLPVNPFAGSAKGDWVALRYKETGNAAEPSPPAVYHTFKIEKVEGDAVTVRTAAAPDDEPRQLRAFSRSETPTLSALIHAVDRNENWDAFEFGEAKVEDETRTVAGHAFACKKLSGVVEVKGGRGGKVWFALWLCPEVKSNGVVALELKATTTSGEAEEGATWEIVGFGSAEKTLWGKTPKELVPAKK